MQTILGANGQIGRELAKFRARFPDFQVTSFREGMTRIREERAGV